MNNFTKEYARVVNCISLDENSKENLFYKLTENSGTSKYETKKQIAVVSAAAIAVVACVSYFVRFGNKIR